MSRADIVKPKLNPPIFFSDFPNDLAMAPFSGDLARLTNVNAVINSVKNIVRTMFGERPYDNTIGTSIGFQEFQLLGTIENQIIDNAVRLAILQNEPRAKVIKVVVNNPGYENAISLQVSFYVVNNPQVITVSVIVRRNR